MLIVLGLLAVLAVVLATRRFLPALSEAYREARRAPDAGGIREIDRRLAERILAADTLPVREEAPFPLAAGEKVYYQTAAERVIYQGRGRIEKVAEGTIWVTDRRFIFLRKEASGFKPGAPGAEESGGLTIACGDVQRVDSLHVNLLELTYIKDASTHAFDTVWFAVPRPLTLSAVLSRFAGFDLVLG